MVRVQLFSVPGCAACDTVRSAVEQLRGQGAPGSAEKMDFEFQEVDLSENPTLGRELGVLACPAVAIDGVVELVGPVGPRKLAKAIQRKQEAKSEPGRHGRLGVRAFWASVALVGVIGLAAWGSASGPPEMAVLVAAKNLPAGQRLQASDLVVADIRVQPARSGPLIPGLLKGLVAGEYLLRPVLVGQPLLSDEVRRATVGYRPPLAPMGSGAECGVSATAV